MTTEALTAIKAALEAGPTPGPWERGGANGGGKFLVYCDDALGSAICQMDSDFNATPADQRIVNLDFIAACNPSAISSLISSYEAMERRVAGLEEALTPFASYRTADGIYGTDFLRIPDGHPVLFNMKSLGDFAAVDFTVTIGDFRRARSALTPTVEKVETPAQDPSPEAHLVGEEALRAAWSIGRKSWCPASILEDNERTERDWQKARARIAVILTTEGQSDGD